MEPVEPLYFVRFARPAELLFQNGLHDESVTAADALRFQGAAASRRTSGGTPRVTRWATMRDATPRAGCRQDSASRSPPLDRATKGRRPDSGDRDHIGARRP
jgi:hypothetical protein